MRITPAALAEFVQRAGVPEPIVRYVHANRAFTPGYFIFGNGEPKRPTVKDTSLRIRKLKAEPATVECTLERAGPTTSRLYYLSANQSPGPIWYRWRDHEGTRHDLLVHATPPDAELNAAIKDTEQFLRRQSVVWRLAYEARVSVPKADQVGTAVRGNFLIGRAAFKIAQHLREQSGNLHGAREAIERLGLPENREELVAILFQLKIGMEARDFETALLGAKWALPWGE